ncbi:hypothetical protein [Sphingomonas albertensis]|uniref:hypothetical protein n=1 Tax=Sphingomonas albertensis TaxID=2762591 RepID=UPI001654BD15|nr:hypothetical protein [Sphingomonas albertensis]
MTLRRVFVAGRRTIEVVTRYRGSEGRTRGIFGNVAVIAAVMDKFGRTIFHLPRSVDEPVAGDPHDLDLAQSV